MTELKQERPHSADGVVSSRAQSVCRLKGSVRRARAGEEKAPQRAVGSIPIARSNCRRVFVQMVVNRRPSASQTSRPKRCAPEVGAGARPAQLSK